MTVELTHIGCPKEWEGVDDYSSHRPAIWLALTNNKECRPFSEFGSGKGSTELIKKYCESNGIKFESYENDKEWCGINSMYVENYISIYLPIGYIVFIDSKPGEQRKELLNKFRHNTIVVIHDTESYAQRVYEIENILTTFEYQLYYKPEGNPATSILSNTIDVTKWVNQKLTLYSTAEGRKNMNH